MPGEEPHEVTAYRDAYIAAGDIHIHYPAPAPPHRAIWGNVPARNPGFTGREDLLSAVRNALISSDRAVVQALHGMGGVGKTQIAIEYTHRHADTYEIVWWLNADNSGQLGEQFAALAVRLGCVSPGGQLSSVRQALREELRGRQSWLLVLDNAGDPEAVAGWLPGGKGHVLITSRVHAWDEVAVPVEVDVLARPESVEILSTRVRGLPADGADAVAEAVGDLPLAVAQAAGHMAETGMPAAEYTRLIHDRATEILELGRPPSYPRSLAAVTGIAFEHLRSQDEAAAELAAICAFLAPEPIPADWFTNAAAQLPAALAGQAADVLAWRQLLSRLSRSALARIDPNGLVMHRLTQAILRGHLPPAQAGAVCRVAGVVVVANDPGDTDLPADWPDWASTLPHVLAAGEAGAGSEALLNLGASAAWYLLNRGDFRTGLEVARRVYDLCSAQLDPGNHVRMRSATSLARALHHSGRYAESIELGRRTLDDARRFRGDDDRLTLAYASNLVGHLRGIGEHQAARELNEDTLARKRRVLGEDHPDTLTSASNLAEELHSAGEYEAARDLGEDTLARRRRVLGEDHPDTQLSARNLAVVLRALDGENGADAPPP